MKAVFFFFIFISHVFSSPDITYGIGEKGAGRASSITADGSNPFAAISNPGSLSLGKSQFAFSATSVSARLTPIGREAETPRIPDHVVWALGYSSPFRLPLLRNRGAWGVTESSTVSKLRVFSGNGARNLFSLRYGTSELQFKATFAGAIEVFPLFTIGGGASFYMATAGNAEINIISQDPQSILALDVGLRGSPVVGVKLGGDETACSLVVREAIDPAFVQQIAGTITVGGETVLQQPVTVKTSLYYEPLIVESDFQHNFGPFKGSVGVSFQRWVGYVPPFLITEVPNTSGTVSRTQVPTLSMRNTISPRLGVEIPMLPTLHLSAGYSFRPTPVLDVSGEANPLDSDVHVASFSIRHSVSLTDFSFFWALSGQYHWLSPRNFEKQDPQETSYRLEGRAFSLGLTLGTLL